MIGTRIGHFQVLEKLGEGGMGVVYKARDTHLDRFIAIKVLPADKVADPERKARFVQEARAASALNHPNIIHIYDISSEAGTDFMAMEYVAGKTLDQLIPRKGMRLNEALKIAVQVADAMARAHEAGIVHRDLKPSNVMVDERGLVKVVDFGLAKLAEPPGTGVEGATRTALAKTEEGRVVGTLAYMSPEQAEGRPLDGRSDIFCFGAVLYEMVTGRRAFGGDTAAGMLAAVIKDHPQAVSEVAPDTPPDLEKLIARCLQKAPERRWQTMADLRVALSELKEESDSDAAGGRAAPAAARGWSSRWRWVAAAVLPIVIGGAVLVWRYTAREAPPQAPILTSEDVIVLADFANSTGDPVFDVALREKLSSEIENSNLLRTMSAAQMRTLLAEMKRPPDAPITAAVANELCVRAGEKAFVEGSIAALGNTYVLMLKAVSCQTGETLGSQVIEARGKEQVLGALASAVNGLRERLGEALPNIQRTAAAALPGATTVLEAYQAYGMGMLLMGRGEPVTAAIPHLERATQLDPDFGSAYLAQAIAYGILGQNNRARELFRKGYEHRTNASERERLWIEARYYQEEGDLEQARAILERLVRLYPNHLLGINTLGNLHGAFGDFEQALPLYREVIRLAPESSLGYGQLMATLMSLDRFEDARAVAEMPVPKRQNPFDIRLYLLRLHYLEGDQVAAQAAITALEEPALVAGSLRIQQPYALAVGRFRSADALQAKADAVARRRGFVPPDLVGTLGGTAWKANAGLCADVEATATPELLDRDIVLAPVAIAALATCGGVARAERLADRLVKLGKRGQWWDSVELPLIRARVLLARGRPAEAVATLDPARVFERAVAGIVLARGEAYLMSGKPGDAAAEFRKILGVKANLLRSDYSAAQVGLARALAASADVDGARKAYESFFDLWKSADADVPLLLAARSEYDTLRRSVTQPPR